MIRSSLAAIAGYVVIVVVVVAGIGLSWAILGGEGAFAGEGPQPSTSWMIANLVTGFVAAVAGGWVAHRLGASRTAVRILIGLILVLGLIGALTADSQYAKRTKIDKPVSDMTFIEAGGHAKQPTWYNWIIPLIGAAGAWVGGQRRVRRTELRRT
jgi:hypothetical protein